jgi:hypothetical protein
LLLGRVVMRRAELRSGAVYRVASVGLSVLANARYVAGQRLVGRLSVPS